MEILNKVTTAEEWRYDIKCRACEAELRIGATDLKAQGYSAGDQRDQYTAYRFIVDCPVCHTQITIAEEGKRELPDGTKMPILVVQVAQETKPSQGRGWDR